MVRWWQKISITYPKLVSAIAVVVIAVAGWYGVGLFSNLSGGTNMNALNTPSAQAEAIIKREFGAAPSNDVILFQRADKSLGDANSPDFQQVVAGILAPLGKKADSIMTYAATGSANFISNDKTMTYAIVNMPGEPSERYSTLRKFADNADQSKLKVSIGGEAALTEEMNSIVSHQLGIIEFISLPILLILLFIFFRSAVAALVPLGIALFSVLGAFAIARFLSNFVGIDTYAVNVITILGLGLSIDYALLSVNRFREELPGGVDHAVKTMIATSGHTIVFSGVTVIACLLALLVFPFDIMHSIAIGGAAAVAVAMTVTYLVLPSALKLLGHGIDKWRLPIRKTAKTDRTFWHKVSALTTKHPVVSFVIGLVVVVLALLPILQFKPGHMDYNWLARGAESQQVAQKLSSDFPSSTPDTTVVLDIAKPATTVTRLKMSCDITKQISAIDGVKSVMSSTPLQPVTFCQGVSALPADYAGKLPFDMPPVLAGYMAEGAIKFDVFFSASDTASEEKTLLAIRTISTSYGQIWTSGKMSEFYDSNQAYIKAAPYAIGAIIISMLVLLASALRSFVVPLQAVIINSLGLAISIAAIVGVFQLGWFSSLTGWPQVDGIVLAAPILVAAIAFGLAMDYSVFLYSRMREVYDQTGDSTEAVRQGIIKTGPIITAAAIALFVVVAGFVTSSVLFLQIVGLGMAVAVLVDAFFIRLILVPSIMTLVGKYSWK